MTVGGVEAEARAHLVWLRARAAGLDDAALRVAVVWAFARAVARSRGLGPKLARLWRVRAVALGLSPTLWDADEAPPCTAADPAQLGAAYEALRVEGRRAAGRYYTPAALAAAVVARACAAVSSRGASQWTVCDPACGGGAFLLAALAVLGEGGARRCWGGGHRRGRGGDGAAVGVAGGGRRGGAVARAGAADRGGRRARGGHAARWALRPRGGQSAVARVRGARGGAVDAAGAGGDAQAVSCDGGFSDAARRVSAAGDGAGGRGRGRWGCSFRRRWPTSRGTGRRGPRCGAAGGCASPLTTCRRPSRGWAFRSWWRWRGAGGAGGA
jgi:hypothetical protein